MDFSLNDAILEELGVFVPDDSIKKEFVQVEKLTRYYRKKIISKLFGDNEYSNIPVEDIKFPWKHDMSKLVSLLDHLSSWKQIMKKLCREKNRNDIHSYFSSYFFQENVSTEIITYMYEFEFCDYAPDICIVYREQLSEKYYTLLIQFTEILTKIISNFIFKNKEYRRLQIRYGYGEKYLLLENIIFYFVCKQIHNRNIRDSKENLIPFLSVLPRIDIITQKFRDWVHKQDEEAMWYELIAEEPELHDLI